MIHTPSSTLHPSLPILHSHLHSNAPLKLFPTHPRHLLLSPSNSPSFKSPQTRAFQGLSIDTSTDERDSTFIAAMKARTAAAAAAEEKRVAEQTKDAFGRDEFPLIAAEVMRDTMYNLMQEAMYDEFHIMVEPLSFAVKNES